MIHIFYRYCGRENNRPRPSFYNKRVCLQSLLGAFERVPKAHLTLISDSDIPNDIISLIKGRAEIVQLSNVGVEHSFIQTLQEVPKRSKNELVYLVEDDYIHLPDALEKLVECYHEHFSDYITLFDDPLRYKLSENVPPDLPVSKELFVSKSHHWRVIESTTFTFAGNAKTIHEDIDIFTYHTLRRIKEKKYVMDRESWRQLQSLGDYSSKGRKRKLIGAIPSLATHCETTALSPTINWENFLTTITTAYE